MTVQSRLMTTCIALTLIVGAVTVGPAVANDASEDSKNLRENQTSSAGTGVAPQTKRAPQIAPAPRRKHKGRGSR